MNRFLTLLLLLACLSPAGSAPVAEAIPATKAAVAARFDFESFRILSERNIFDPNRSARGDSTRTTRREPDRRVRTETFSLLGTMSYEKGQFAFFDGSSSDYRRVLQPDGAIAGFTIAAVAPTCVRLTGTNGQTIELCVGMQMSRREEEEWRVQDRASESSGSTTAVSGKSESGGPGGDEALKRLLQRRQEEEGGAPAPPGDSNNAASPGATSPSEAPPAAVKEAAPKPTEPKTETDDVVKRLLQKREQELNK
jgi:hypothetical protein